MPAPLQFSYFDFYFQAHANNKKTVFLCLLIWRIIIIIVIVIATVSNDRNILSPNAEN